MNKLRNDDIPTSLLPACRSSVTLDTPRVLRGAAQAKQMACSSVVLPAPLTPAKMHDRNI